ncbi:MAG: MarR family winged helix-turn-helix transcriptional regulator [Nitriliruptorales bacterium]
MYSKLEVVKLIGYVCGMTHHEGQQGAQHLAAPFEASDVFAHEIHELLFELLLRLRGRVESAASAHDLSPSQFLVLRALDSPRAMGALAVALRCDASNVTGIIDRLEERALVRRRVARDDRRVKQVVITPEGERLRDELRRQVVENSSVATGLTAAERYALVGLLRRLLAAP